MKIGAVEAESITQYMDVTAVTDRADLLFVFGTMLPQPAYMAAEAFARDQFEYVVLTGGKNRLTGANEAEAHLQILLNSGYRESVSLLRTNPPTRARTCFLLCPI